MAEKIRGALFNILGELDGLEVLDAFAGSGALSFEAASRGAKAVVAIERDPQAHSVIERNVRELGLEDVVKPVRASAGGWSLNNPDKQFDIVLLAPPYNDLQEKLLRQLVMRHVKPTGLLVVDWPGKLDQPEFDYFDIISSRGYGDAQLIFYKNGSNI